MTGSVGPFLGFKKTGKLNLFKLLSPSAHKTFERN